MPYRSPLSRRVVVTGSDSRFSQALVPTLPDAFSRPDGPIVDAGGVKAKSTTRTGAAISRCEQTTPAKQRGTDRPDRHQAGAPFRA